MTKLRTRVVAGVAVVGPSEVRPHPRGRAWDRIRMAVAERDRWVCQLCGEAIDPALKRPHPRALHAHHVIELAAGGSDAMSNLQASHARCNERA